jgi:hypothetical protein
MNGDYLGTRVFLTDDPINVLSASEHLTGKVKLELDL